MAHVDAGKTTLTERLLFLAGNIPQVGEVDEGQSTMDFLPEEQERGISIEAGIAHLEWKGHSLCLVDTPGHIDFTNEVDPFLRGVESALLVVSAASGLEPQTLECWKKISAHNLTPFIFLNKMDLPHQPLEDVLAEIDSQWNREPLVLTFPYYDQEKLAGIVDVIHGKMVLMGTDIEDFRLVDIPPAVKLTYQQMRSSLLDVASRHSDVLTEKWMQHKEPSVAEIYEGLKLALIQNEYIPVYCGSAKKGAGVRLMLNGIVFLSPPLAPALQPGTRFEVLQLRHLTHQGILGVCRFYESLQVDETLGKFFSPLGAQLTPVHFCEEGAILLWKPNPPQKLDWGLRYTQTGICIDNVSFPPALLWTNIEACNSTDVTQLSQCIENLAASTSGISVKLNAHTGTYMVGGMGEVQLEVFISRLKNLSSINFNSGVPQVDYLEQPVGQMGPLLVEGIWGSYTFQSTLTIEPADCRGVEISFLADLDPEGERILKASLLNWSHHGFWGMGSLGFTRIHIGSILSEGKIPPWPMVAKALTDVLRLRLKQNNFRVLEPIMEMECQVPLEFSGKVLGDLESKKAAILNLTTQGKYQKIFVNIPLKNCFGYTTLLRSLTKGQGNLVLKYKQHGSW